MVGRILASGTWRPATRGDGEVVRVVAAGGFDASTWQSTGIDYLVEVSSDASTDQLAQLLDVVDQVAEIPRAIRTGAGAAR